MPLTLSLFDDDEQAKRRESKGPEIPRLHGQFIIDRNNIIIRVAPNHREMPHEGKESEELLIARSTRDGLNRAISWHLRKSESLKDSLIEQDMDDPQHLAKSHVSQVDQHDAHFHIKFNRQIDGTMMQQFFRDVPYEAVSSFVSKQCWDNLKDGTKSYFFELEKNPQAQELERDYNREKAEHYRTKTTPDLSELGTPDISKPGKKIR